MSISKSTACVRAAVGAAFFLLAASMSAAQAPFVGPNVNMVSGTKWPEGDPFLTKQNEESHAVSSRNARHLLGGSNDYRLVPAEIADGLADPEAWIQIYKSLDGGASWRSTPLGGCPLNIPQCIGPAPANDPKLGDPYGLTAPLKALAPNFGADPTVRSGPYGTFFVAFIAGTRGSGANGVTAVQRFVDKNNDIQRATDARTCVGSGNGCVPVYTPSTCTGPGSGCTTSYVKLKQAEDPILPDAMAIVDTGTPGQFKDKPWVAADVGGRAWNAGKTCELLSWTKNRSDVANAAETVPAFNVYVSLANFTGQSANNQHPQARVAVSTDCGKTFGKPIKLSGGLNANSGTNIAIDPLTGTVYVVWRNFDTPGGIYVNKSTDGGVTWMLNAVPVAGFTSSITPYDQAATGVSFRTLTFPTIAVSVVGTQSRVHVAWTQRRAAVGTTAPYACQSATPADCDARIVMATSRDGGATWPAPVAVDSAFRDPLDPTRLGRGHQVQPALAFAAGKLLISWYDQRLDHTEGVLRCQTATCASVNNLVEVREAKGNLDPACTFPVGLAAPLVGSCLDPAVVWSTYITDGTPKLVRRHTLDVYAAMADPADRPVFSSTRVSQYAFGSTVAGSVNSDGTLTPIKGPYDIRQKEISPPNLPMFASARAAFHGDYMDVAGQNIVATGDPANGGLYTYKFNVGGTSNGNFTTGGLPPVFHVAFTDNRDVIPPLDGNWVTPTCLTAAFTKDSSGNVNGTTNFNVCSADKTGFAGNRNQNVYSAVVAETSIAYANTNSKLLSGSAPRGFVVTVQNVSDTERTYALTIPPQTSGVSAAFVKESLPSPGTVPPLTVKVQPRSSTTRTVWAMYAGPATAKSKVLVNVASTDGLTPAFSSQLVLNADPMATGAFVTNSDGTTVDLANDDLGNVVLSNAVLTNNVLTNNALTNNVLTNSVLTNAALSNVVLSNAVLSNLQVENAALTNNVLTNNVLSNVVLTNAALTNNVLSNAVLSNVVLSNNSLNAALTNLDPANVALSNAALTNNALTNVALTNNVLTNAMLTNAALTNAALTNAALSNAALTNNVLTNNALSNVVLSNAPLADTSGGLNEKRDADPLRTIEPAAFEIAKNDFNAGDLGNSNFRETTFSIRNHGNTDTTLSVKLMLRDAVCTGNVQTGPYTCSPPAGYKLQLILRKVGFVPSAIAPTKPAKDTGRVFRLGLVQRNTEVSNIGNLPIISPEDVNFGKFLADDPSAATLPLAAGEWAYATIRAIGTGGTSPPDPADLLRWGVKTVSANSTSADGPLVIRTLSFPLTPAFVAGDQATPAFRAFGGTPQVTGSAVCSDKDGNFILQGTGAPAVALGAAGNFYIDTAAEMVFGPKGGPGTTPQAPWVSVSPASPTPQIGVAQPGDLQTGPKAGFACPPAGIAVTNPFVTDANRNSTTTLTFTPKFWGEFFMRAGVFDSTNALMPKDEQVIRAVVQPRPPVVAFTDFLNDVAPQRTYNNNGLGTNLRPLVSSDSKNGFGVAQRIVFGASGSCHMSDADNLVIDRATFPIANPADCIVTVHQDGNEIYAPVNVTKPIFIERALQTIDATQLPVDNNLTFNNGNLPFTLIASVRSTTAPNSGLAVTYTSSTPAVCTTGGDNGASLTITGSGTCTIAADQAGDPNYKPLLTFARSFFIRKADQNITFGTAPSATFNTPFVVSATSASPTAPAPPSGIPITFSSLTTPVCTVNGATVTVVAAGNCTIAANQVGNGNYNAAPQVTQNITIARATQNIAFGQAPANVTFGDPPVSVSATSTSPTAPPSLITITFSSTTTAVCTVSGTTVSIVAAGTCTIAADQPGNTNYNAATQVTQSFTIARATLTVSATATPSSFTYGDDVPPTPMTVVSYGATYSPPAACLLAPATATFSGQPPTSPANAGTYAIAPTITSAVSASCDVVPVNATLTVNKAPTQFTVDSFVFTPLFSPTTIAGKLNRPDKPSVYPNALAIALAPNATFPSSATPGAPDGMFTAAAAANSVPSNTYAVTFSFAGNSNFLAAAPVTATLRVEGFSAAGDMTQARARHSSTLLDDGRVLIAGGFDGAFARAATSEVYCPDTMPDPPPAVAICPNGRGAFGLMGSLSAGSEGHTSTRLLNGKVLKVGGRNAVAELFDPATGQWTVLTAVLPGGPRTFHTATLLSCAGHCAYDGKVLITGGDDFVSAGDGRNNTLNSTLIFDPATNTFADGPPMSAARYVHSANLLPNGKVLIAGGEQKSGAVYVALGSAEIYDPTADPAACLPSTLGCMIPANAMTSLRYSHGATALADGRVLIAGGSNDPTGQRTGLLDTAEVYDYLGNTWTALTPANQLGAARRSFPMTRLFDDWVLAAGGLGVDPNPRLSSSSLFEPGFNAFAAGASLSTARARHKATRLLDGRVLITGGTIQVGAGADPVQRDTAIGSAEFYNGPPPMP